MKKMLVKAVALSLVLGGVGFVANDAQAANISDGVKVHSADIGLNGFDVKTDKQLPDGTALANQKDLVKVNEEVAINKTNITKNAENINKNTIAIEKEAGDREAQISMVKDDIKANGEAIKANSDAIKTKADAWETTKNFSKVQEQLDAQDNKNKAQDVSIKAHTAAIKANKEAIKTKADALETTKKFANVQEQLDT